LHRREADKQRGGMLALEDFTSYMCEVRACGPTPLRPLHTAHVSL